MISFNLEQFSIFAGANSYAVIVTSDDFDEEFTEDFFMELIVTSNSAQIPNLRPGTVYRLALQSIGNRNRRSRRSFSSFQQTCKPRSFSSYVACTFGLQFVLATCN